MALVQALFGLMITAVVMTALLSVVVNLQKSQLYATSMPSAHQKAQDMALLLASQIRAAELCTATDSGCTVDAAVEATSATAITVYGRDSANALTETIYRVQSTNFQKVVGNTTTTIFTNATLALTYYTSTTYHAATLTTYTPDSTTTKNLIGVKIVASATENNLTSSFTTFVRLRNSPKKVLASD
jgi:hypothetical protein